MTENNKRARIRKSPPGTKLHTTISRNTNLLTKGRKKIPDLLDFFVTSGISPSYTDMKPSYDLSSDHTPTTMTISTSLATHITTTKLHTSITDWNKYKTVVRDKLTTKMKLKTREDIEVATSKLIDILQHAVKTANQVKNRPKQVKYLPSHIKQLVAQKHRARARWQKTHTPEDRRHFNNANN